MYEDQNGFNMNQNENGSEDRREQNTWQQPESSRPQQEEPRQEEPRQEAPRQEQPASGAYAYRQYYTAEPERRTGGSSGGNGNHNGWKKVVAVAACCAVIGGGLGAGAVGLATGAFSAKDTQSSAAETEEEKAPEQAGTSEAAQAETSDTAAASESAQTSDTGSAVNFVPSTITVASNDESTQLTPEQIYETYVSAVVIVTQQGTTTNIYGMTSTTAATGSGFVLTEDGYILTNYHVVEGADTLTVTLDNGTEYPATVVGYDDDNDVALIKIDATGLTTVSIGDSSTLKVGQQVLAIGNPLGELTNTLTVGYVSATEREIQEDSSSAPINMLQTDCAINGGNSGGPLFDLSGNVVGITTAKYTGSEVEGLGFAIPINDAMDIVDQILQYGYVKDKPYMGVQIANMNESTAEAYNLPMGAYVYSVEEGGAAETAGLVKGDIITEIDGTEVSSYSDLVSAIRNYKAGDTVEMKVYHSGSYEVIKLTFDEKPQETETTEDTTQEQQQEDQSSYNTFPFGSYGYGSGNTYGYGYGSNN